MGGGGERGARVEEAKGPGGARRGRGMNSWIIGTDHFVGGRGMEEESISKGRIGRGLDE